MKSLFFSKSTRKLDAPSSSHWEDDAILLDRDDVSDFNEENILPVSPEERAKIRKWLKPTAYNDEGSEFKKHLTSHLKDTGTWLLSAPTYKKWHSSKEDGILWVKGIPGSGKSVVAAALIDHLRQENVPVLYFFFRQIIDANHVPQAALRDWLDQILEYSPPLQAKLAQHLKESRSLQSLSVTDFWASLKLALLYLPRAYCVVDALDEIDHSQDMLDFLEGLSKVGTWRPSQVKFVITSRPVPSVEVPLRHTPTLEVRLDEDEVDRDIAMYVQHAINTSAIEERHHEDIRKAVPGNANGLFLYAKLAMDAFLELGADPHQVLKNLPTDLNVMYDDLLREHTRRTGISPDMQLLIMQSVTHASRPLRLLELAEMINITQFSDSTRDLKNAKNLVRTACGPLLEILPDETISVIHHSLTEFLKGSTRRSSIHGYPILEPGVTHHRLALACLAYLQSGCFDTITSPTKVPRERMRSSRQNPFSRMTNKYSALPAFTQYAAINWHVHIRKSMLAGFDQSQINVALDKFVASNDFDKWVHVADIGRGQATPLFVAVSLGLTQYCESLVAQQGGGGINGVDVEPPLYHAAKNGFADIVQILVDNGADLQDWGRDGYRPLHIAAMHNHPKVVGVLLKAGADPFCKPQQTSRSYDWGLEPKGTPVSKACSYGHVDTVAELLPYLKTEAAVTDALFVAVNYTNPAVVALLLTHPMANVNKKSRSQTLLYVACSKRDVQSIKMLLEAGADPNTKIETSRSTTVYPKPPEGSGYTAIHVLAGAGNLRSASFHVHGSTKDQPTEDIIEAFELMLEKGANVHQIDRHGQNVLFHASDGVTARILLDAGVDPHQVNKQGETLLYCHARLDVLQHLLERTKIDTSIRVRYWDSTPLLKSLKDGLVEKALLLLEFGADCTGSEKDGNGAFHLAVGINYDNRNKGLQGPLFVALHTAGADVNMRNKAGCTPLHTLDFRNFNDELFALLLDAGLNTEATNDDGETALFAALKVCPSYNLSTVCDRMVAAGCNLFATDNKGRNLLHVLKTTDTKVVQYLVDKGLDPKQVDDEGNTLWHIAAEGRFNVDLFQKLREFDIDPEQPNKLGRTPLHVFSSFRPHALDEGPFKNSFPITIAATTGFDVFLSYITQINPRDAQGVTPLHLTSTFSEYLTRRFLEVGADPFARTEEGLTVFHLAARSRQPNILGVLFDFCAGMGDTRDLSSIVNAEDRLGRTAIFYACASACVESVKILVEAGATVEFDRYEASAWQGCVLFEHENKNWQYKYRADGRNYDWSAHRAEGVTIEDRVRPDVREAYHDSSGFKHRIDEITSLLSSYKSFTEKYLSIALDDAVRQELDYTVDCLTRLHASMNVEVPHELLAGMNACLQRRHQSPPSFSKYYACWQNRKFNLGTEQLMEDGVTSTVSFRMSRIHQLVHDGFVAILEKVLTPEIAQQFDDMNWISGQAKASHRSGSGPLYPLLVTACQRNTPNMDMVRFLVERMAVDVNAQGRFNEQTSGGLEKQSALHFLVRGLNWWQTRQALPYLLSKGAVVDLKDANDFTPLHACLERVNTILFDKYPIEILVNAGADLDSVTTRYGIRDISCLSSVAENPEMTRYLLEHGATVTHFDVKNAIAKGRCDILDLLLSHGGDPNGRDTQGAQFDDRSNHDHRGRGGTSLGVRKREAMFPLHYLAILQTADGVGEQMVNILLQYGADVNAWYDDTALVHCLLTNSRIARLLLIHPDLDIEVTNADGCTLLLAAGQEQGQTQHKDTLNDEGISLVRFLLNRGANIRARDKSGKNLLHEMLSEPKRTRGGSYYLRESPRNVDVGFVVSLCPGLVHERDLDGNTPLHYAAKKHIKLVTDLLDAGAEYQIRNKKGDTALHHVMQGTWRVNANDEIVGLRREILERLLALGADLHARNARAETPIFHIFRGASVVPDEDAPKERREAYGRGRVILEAPLYAMLQDKGVSWTDVDIDNQSLLHVVAGMSRDGGGWVLHRFKFLLSKGLDVAAEDKWRRTPLDVAAGHQHTGIMALYKKEGHEVKPRSERYP